ncbi:MAG TPA: DoxX family protein [Allosphingosinicella sp.]
MKAAGREGPEAPPGPRAAAGESWARRWARWALAAAYLLAGIAHLRSPAGFVAITPAWVPWPRGIVALTGLCELAGAIGLLVPWTRRAAAIGLALYALCVWPANINHALHDIPLGGAHLSWWYHGPRLALQPVIIWWAWWAGGVTDWPFRRRRVTR